MSRILSLIVILVLTSSCDKNKVIFVSSTLADCKNNSSEKCLKVKENKEDEWTVLDNDIEGFEHKDGFLQKIEVRVSKIKNPPADGEVFNYKFIKLIYEQKEEIAAIKVVPNTKIMSQNYAGKWQINSMVGMDSLTKPPTMIFKDGQISGNAGCNNYGATYTLNGSNIAFGLTHTTKMMCIDVKIEKTYFQCLAQAKTYKLADKLTFYDADNVEIMSCSKIEE